MSQLSLSDGTRESGRFVNFGSLSIDKRKSKERWSGAPLSVQFDSGTRRRIVDRNFISRRKEFNSFRPQLYRFSRREKKKERAVGFKQRLIDRGRTDVGKNINYFSCFLGTGFSLSFDFSPFFSSFSLFFPFHPSTRVIFLNGFVKNRTVFTVPSVHLEESNEYVLRRLEEEVSNVSSFIFRRSSLINPS